MLLTSSGQACREADDDPQDHKRPAGGRPVAQPSGRTILKIANRSPDLFLVSDDLRILHAGLDRAAAETLGRDLADKVRPTRIDGARYANASASSRRHRRMAAGWSPGGPRTALASRGDQLWWGKRRSRRAEAGRRPEGRAWDAGRLSPRAGVVGRSVGCRRPGVELHHVEFRRDAQGVLAGRGGGAKASPAGRHHRHDSSASARAWLKLAFNMDALRMARKAAAPSLALWPATSTSMSPQACAARR